MDNDIIMIDAGNPAADHRMRSGIRRNHRLSGRSLHNVSPLRRDAPLPPTSSSFVPQKPKSILLSPTSQNFDKYRALNPGNRRFHPYAKTMRKEMRLRQAQGKSSTIPSTGNEKEDILRLQRSLRKRAAPESDESEEHEPKRVRITSIQSSSRMAVPPIGALPMIETPAVVQDRATVQVETIFHAPVEIQTLPQPVAEPTVIPSNTTLADSIDARFRQVTELLKGARQALHQGVRSSIEFAATLGHRFLTREEPLETPVNIEESREISMEITEDDISAAGAQLQFELTDYTTNLPSPVVAMLSQGEPSAAQLQIELADHASHPPSPSIVAEPHIPSLTSANLMAQDRSMVDEDIATAESAVLEAGRSPKAESNVLHQTAEILVDTSEDHDVRAIRAAITNSRVQQNINLDPVKRDLRHRRSFPPTPHRRPHMPRVSPTRVKREPTRLFHMAPEDEENQVETPVHKEEKDRPAEDDLQAGIDQQLVAESTTTQPAEVPAEEAPDPDDAWDPRNYRPGEPPLLPRMRGRNIRPIAPSELEREIEARVEETADQLAATTVVDREPKTPGREEDSAIHRSVTWLENDTPMGKPVSAVRLFHATSPPMNLRNRVAPLKKAEWEAIEREKRLREERERQEERKRLLREREDSLGRKRIPDGEAAVRPLSNEWNERLQTAMLGPAQRTLVTSLEGAELTKQKMLTCYTPAAWLNDEVVNGHLALTVDYLRGLANNRGGRNVKPKYYAFNSFFYSKLREDGYAAVSRWTRRAKIQGKALLDVDLLFIPVHQHSHWTLLVVSPKHRTIEYFDSLGSGSGAFVKNIKEWLKGELDDAYDEDEWCVLNTPSPQQDNGSDCGVFLLTTAKAVALGLEPTVYGPADIPLIRRKIVAELINGSLEGDFNPAGEDGAKRL